MVQHQGLAFLRKLWPAGVPDGQRLLIWCLPDKHSRYFSTPEAAAEQIDLLPATYDVYFGVGTRPAGLAAEERGKSADVTALPAFWIDIDVAGPGHKKQNLPPSKPEALNFLQSLPVKPSLYVDSGRGLHAYWVWKEPWVFDDADERVEAERLTTRWVEWVRTQAQRHKWDVDAVQDLARVMRVPGTLNNKVSEAPVPCTLIEDGGLPYAGPAALFEAAGLDLYEQAPLAEVAAAQVAVVGKLVLRSDANPPAHKLAAFLTNIEKFRRTWLRQRTDLKDQSQSSYDQALANFAVQAEWDDQEIANLIIAHRRQHGADLTKVLSPLPRIRGLPYAAATIREARASAATYATNTAQQLAAETISTIATVAGTNGHGPDGAAGPDDDAERLKQLREAMGLPLVRLIQYGRNVDCTYRLLLDNGKEVPLGNGQAVFGWRTFASSCMATVDALPPYFAPKTWAKLISALNLHKDVYDIQGSDARVMLRDWIRSYIGRSTTTLWKEDEYQQAAVVGDPFVREGALHLVAGGLLRWVNEGQRQRLDRHELFQLLHTAGWRETQVSYTPQGGARTTRLYWRVGMAVYQDA